MEQKDRIRAIRNSTGMNRKEFAEYFGIPYPTITDWELGNRHMPDYVLRLIAYKVEMEKLDRKKGNLGFERKEGHERESDCL